MMKVLFVGLGAIGQRHVRNLRALLGDEVELLAVRQRGLAQVIGEGMQLQAGKTLEAEYSIRALPDLETALAEKPDAVFVCNPTHLHLETALSAARAGCALFLEKPLSHSMEGVSELLQIVDEKKLVALVGYQMRFHPCLKLLNEILQNGEIGQPVAVRLENGEYLPGWHPYEDYRQSYAAREEMGGGVILSQIHEFDLILHLFGMPKKVLCMGGQLSNLEVDVEDVTSNLFQCEDNGRVLPVHLQQDYLQRPPRRTMEVLGDAGKVEVDWRAPFLRQFDAHENIARDERFESFARNQLFEDEMKHFLACLRGEETPQVSAQDGAQSLKMALAAKASLARGEVVMI